MSRLMFVFWLWVLRCEGVPPADVVRGEPMRRMEQALRRAGYVHVRDGWEPRERKAGGRGQRDRGGDGAECAKNV